MPPLGEIATHTTRPSATKHHHTTMAAGPEFSIRWTPIVLKMTSFFLVASLAVSLVEAAPKAYPAPAPAPAPRPVAFPGPAARPYPTARPYAGPGPGPQPAPRPQAQRQPVSDTAIESALSDRRYLQRQLKCALGEAPCDPVGRRLKTLAPLVLRGSCPQCSPSEVRQIQKVLSHIQRNYPREWGKLVREFAG